MSQVQHRRNISQVEQAPITFGDTVPSIPIRSACPELFNSISAATSQLKSKQSQTTRSSQKTQCHTISSPVQLRQQFRTRFKTISSSSSITQQKQEAIQLIQSMDYRVRSTESISRNIAAIHNVQTRTELETSVQRTMQDIQTEHTAVFAEHVSSVVRTAAAKVGFTQVSVKRTPTTINIISQNNQGQAIVAQIDSDPKSAQLDLATETVGFKGNSCETVLQKFDQELEKAGLKHKPDSVKWTEDNSFLPLAKTAKKKLDKKAIKKNKKSKNSKDRTRRIQSRNHLRN